MKPRELALILIVTSRLLEGEPTYTWQLFSTSRIPSQTNTRLFCALSPTHVHPGRTSRSVTHPEIAQGLAHLTSEFFRDELPKKKLQLIGMSILSILSLTPRCHIYRITFLVITNYSFFVEKTTPFILKLSPLGQFYLFLNSNCYSNN